MDTATNEDLAKAFKMIGKLNDLIARLCQVSRDQNELIKQLQDDIKILKKTTVKRANLKSGGYIVTKL